MKIKKRQKLKPIVLSEIFENDQCKGYRRGKTVTLTQLKFPGAIPCCTTAISGLPLDRGYSLALEK